MSKLSVISCLVLCLVVLHQSQTAFVPTPPAYVLSMNNYICSYNVSILDQPTDEVEDNCFFGIKSSTPHVLEMNMAENLLYVATDESIHQFEMVSATTEKDKLLTASAGAISDLSVDWITGNIYYVDLFIEGIRVVNENGSHAYTVVEHIDGLFGLAVDPINRNIFWTTAYSSTQNYAIGQSNLDGSDRKNSFISVTYRPYYLVIDHWEKRLYWTTRKTTFLYKGFIESTNLEGKDHKIIYERWNTLPYGLTVYQDHVVWVDRKTQNQVYWTHKSSGNHSQHATLSPSIKVQDIMLFGNYSQPRGYKNGCSGNNGGCEHLCFPTTITDVKCVCSLGYTLASDNKKCTPVPQGDPENSIIVADTGLGRLFFMDVTTEQLSAVPLSRHSHVSDVAIDPIQKYIFWSNNRDETIMYATFDGSTLRKVKTFQTGHTIIALAVDYVKQLIFYSDADQGVLASTTYDGTTTKMILSENYTYAVVPDMKNEMLYIAVYGYFSRIACIPYNGSLEDQIVLVETRIFKPRTLAVDFEAKQMFWADIKAQTIEMSDLEGNNKRVIKKSNSNLIAGMTVLGNYIYLSDWKNNNQLVRMDRNNNYETEKFGTDQFLHTTAIEAYPTYNPQRSTDRTMKSETTKSPQKQTATDRTMKSETTKSPQKQTGEQSQKDNSVSIIVGVAVVLAVLIVIAVIVVACIITRKRPTPGARFETNNAFENQAYGQHDPNLQPNLQCTPMDQMKRSPVANPTDAEASEGGYTKLNHATEGIPYKH